MLPILLDLKIVKIYTFGVFLVLALFWGLFWLWKNLKRTSFKEDQVFDIVFLSLIGGFIAARLAFVATHFDNFGFDLLKFILINGYPGLSLPGFLVGGFLTLALIARLARLPFFELAAYLIPSLFLALGIGKVGAFLAGTTVGSVTAFPLHVRYVGFEGLRHITALYEAIFMFVGFALSQRLLMNYRRDSINESSILSFFIIVASFSKLILDNFKEDIVYFSGLRVTVIVSFVLFVILSITELVRYRSSLTEKVRSLLNTRAKNHGKKISSYENTA